MPSIGSAPAAAVEIAEIINSEVAIIHRIGAHLLRGFVNAFAF
jgi:hypothetical protein